MCPVTQVYCGIVLLCCHGSESELYIVNMSIYKPSIVAKCTSYFLIFCNNKLLSIIYFVAVHHSAYNVASNPDFLFWILSCCFDFSPKLQGKIQNGKRAWVGLGEHQIWYTCRTNNVLLVLSTSLFPALYSTI